MATWTTVIRVRGNLGKADTVKVEAETLNEAKAKLQKKYPQPEYEYLTSTYSSSGASPVDRRDIETR